jgi:molybdate transport system substrate-binding protein
MNTHIYKLILMATITVAGYAARADEPLLVFAAASLKTALDQTAADFRQAGGAEVKISYGGSSTLAKQIIAGAPADLFIAADEQSMDEAAKANSIKTETRFDFLRNALVIVAPKDSPLNRLELTPEALAKAINGGRVATGEINSVPVGRYAHAALDSLGLWASVEPHLAMTDNVRAALAFVAQGEAPLGIVYATDAASEPKVKVIATFPETSHAPILYPVAVIAGSKTAATAKFVDFIRSPAKAGIFERQGFVVVK